jgi:phosphoribosyl-ATP pyrophosphohydrolase
MKMEKNNVLKSLYDVIVDRKNNPQEGSYTCYLFDKGLDKILKKCGEECSETIIAAKNMDNVELKNEISDLFYHIMVLCVQQGLSIDEVEEVLTERSKKIGNLKQMKVVDKNT